MKILVISHNVISKTSNMGKTLRQIFEGISDVALAQFYIHSEVPTDASVCCNFYRFTDRNAIRSIFPGGDQGKIFSDKDIQTQRHTARTDTGFVGKVYQFGRKRTGGIYLLRNLLWKLTRWSTPRLWKWVEDFSPDVVFFASGDYGFMYDIARTVADHQGVPLVVSCVDDYYLHNRNAGSLLGRWEHKLFLKTVHKTMSRASVILTICPSMRNAYEDLFGKPCRVLHTAASVKERTTAESGTTVAYLGNLGMGRSKTLIQMGRTLLRRRNGYIDVYSGERNPEILKNMTLENGIRFHGAVSAERVLEIMANSMAVIHTESFDPKMQDITRYSVSTKIADSLMNGPCIIAYGPEGIASIDYLKENGAAYVISDPEKLAEGLEEILTNSQLRAETVRNARHLARENHNPEVNPVRVRQWLEQVCEDWKKTERK